MKKVLLFIFCFSTLTALSQTDYTKFVNPLIGTDSEYIFSSGNVLPFAARPWGMNHWTPQTAPNGQQWQYVYDAHFIVGLKQTHQPSPWGGDYAMFSLMPTLGEKKFLEKERQSWYSHKEEISKPHYYKVYLAEHYTTAEMTPSDRGCIMRFTFPKSDSANVVIDAFAKSTYVKVIPEGNKIIGYTTDFYGNNPRAPENFKNYFVITFDRPFSNYSIWKDDGFVDGIFESNAGRSGVVVTFSTRDNEPVVAKMASSFISHEQAQLNFNREIKDKTFDEIFNEGRDVWNSKLSRFVVEDNSMEDLDNIRMFYSCLYRMFIYPRTFHEYDANGNIIHYSPFNGEVLPGRMYTDNGYWDTFRAARPFFDLFFPEWSSWYLEGIANTYKESGWLPEWVSPGHVDAMVGSNSASIIASAYLNGIKNLDMETLWEAMYKMAYNAHPKMSSVGRAGAKSYDEFGYVPSDVGVRENIARTLEYAYDDFCVLKVGEAMGKDPKILDVFRKRSLNYKNVFNKKYNLMSNRDSKGIFDPNFNPIAWGHGFTEGNSWHYTWSVFHDPKGLAKLMGGDKPFINMLDSVFKVPPVFDVSDYRGQVIHEVREMQVIDMGQYAHGNQPIQHMIYLYDWSSEPWKTQYWSREVMRRLYSPTPDGYCGDEDNGQTSAWYVFSALGMYPVNPAAGEYAIGSPLFRNVSVTLPSEKKLKLSAPVNSEKNKYVNKVTINGKKYEKNYFTIEQIQSGGTILFDMKSTPNLLRGTTEADRPYSFSNEL
jgi:predicted alpha-1,2-mannosidase